MPNSRKQLCTPVTRKATTTTGQTCRGLTNYLSLHHNKEGPNSFQNWSPLCVELPTNYQCTLVHIHAIVCTNRVLSTLRGGVSARRNWGGLAEQWWCSWRKDNEQCMPGRFYRVCTAHCLGSAHFDAGFAAKSPVEDSARRLKRSPPTAPPLRSQSAPVPASSFNRQSSKKAPRPKARRFSVNAQSQVTTCC